MGDSYVVPPLPSPPPDPAPADDQVSELPRSYQVWKGNNVFLLRGTLIFGPDARSVLLTIALIVAPVVVFCSVVATKLIDEFPNYMGVLIFVIAVVLTLIGLVFLLSTSGRDPGIVPRNSRPPEPEGFEGYTPPVTPGQSPPFRLPRSKDVTVNGKVVKTKYCDTCMLYRPPRCSHCSICNNCVEKFDHHCPWVGQCIGLRNYRFFFMFIFTTTILCLYVHGFSWVYIKRIMEADDISIWKAMAKTPASIALIVYTFISVWFVGGLSAFHLYLISLNQSTYENFRYRYDGQANPYNRGVMKNFGEVFCSRIPQSKNNFRARVPKEAKIPPRVISANFASPNIDKTGGDIEMGRKPVWDEAARHGNDFGEMVRNDRGLNEDNGLAGISPELSRILLPHAAEGRSVLHSRRPSLGITGGNWDISPEVHPLAMRVGSNDGGNLTSERQLSQPDMDRKL